MNLVLAKSQWYSTARKVTTGLASHVTKHATHWHYASSLKALIKTSLSHTD